MSREQSGSGAALGFRLIQYSGIQGIALVGGNMLHLATIGVVAVHLGPSDLGRYSLLLFLGALVTMVFSLAAKPGTIRRTFGSGDDDDDDDEDEDKEVASISPKHTLGTGLLWSGVLGVAATALVVALREPIGDALLGGEHDATLVMWAGILGGAGVLYKVASISLWFERRPVAFLVSEIARPGVSLAVMVGLLAAGGGVEGAIAGVAIGTLATALLAAAMLLGSFEPNLDPAEVKAIVKAAGRRIPIVIPLWLMQNADVFILSRFVDHQELGVYAFASKLSFVVSFLPQGFRVAMRPMRKSAAFKAVRKQYGRPTSSGQLLGYFLLLCISSILLMVLGGEVLIGVAPPAYAAAAGLIPFSAAALCMPALWRTINGQMGWPGKERIHFVAGTIGAALIFIGGTVALAPEIGIYAAPVSMLAGFAVPMLYFAVRCQRGDNRIELPYAELAKALAAAAGVGVAFHALPDYNPLLELVTAAVLTVVYVALLFRLRVIPESHWPALSQMASAVVSGQSHRFRPRPGLRALAPDDRARLRVAVTVRVPPDQLAGPAISPEPPARERSEEIERTEGARLVRLLRAVGVEGGAAVQARSRWDGGIAEFLFADEPPAVRNAAMRGLLTDGANAADLRSLEDLVGHLAKVPADAWEGGRASDSPVARRRRAVGRGSRRAMARAARAIGRRI
jgi:O-antigen/teichoic acid export membrane protein